MIKKYNNRLLLTSIRLVVSLLLMTSFILLFSAQSYAQKVVDRPPTDPQVEERLNDYLEQSDMSAEAGKALLEDVLATLKPTTPLMSVVRARTYYASALLYDDKIAQAYEILNELEQRVEASTIVDAQAEVLANRIDFLTFEGKRGEAFLLVPRLERLLKQTATPRVRYYGHNLLSTIYTNWQRHQEALTHLLDAQKALNQMESVLNQGRRIYLLSSIAHIQLSLEQWSAAIKTVDSTIQEAEEAGFDGLAYDLWFSKYYAQASLGNYERALTSLRNAYQVANKLGLDFQKVIILNNFGDAYMNLGQLDEAQRHLEEARAAAEELEFTDMLSTIDFNLGYIAVKRGDSLGIKQMENITEQFRQDDQLPKYELEQLLGELADAHESLGNYQAQARILKERLRLRKEINEEAQQEQMAELQAVYKTRDNAQQIELLEKQNELKEQVIRNNEQQKLIWILFVIASSVSIVLMFLLYRKSRRMNQRLNRANERLSDQSMRDPLTGLLNRRALQEAMVRREDIVPEVADGLLLLDIDYFKKINDRYGHAAGDKVLLEVSQRLLSVCRESDILVRWGGEEFLFYVRHVDISAIQRLSERVLQAVAGEPIKVGDDVIHVTTTIGFIQLPFAGISEQQVDWERALQIADMALYTGKTQGRNRACGVTALKVDYETARQALEHDLSEAVEEGWIELTTIEGPAA